MGTGDATPGQSPLGLAGNSSELRDVRQGEEEGKEKRVVEWCGEAERF
jgi:hypothetical protein